MSTGRFFYIMLAAVMLFVAGCSDGSVDVAASSGAAFKILVVEPAKMDPATMRQKKMLEICRDLFPCDGGGKVDLLFVRTDSTTLAEMQGKVQGVILLSPPGNMPIYDVPTVNLNGTACSDVTRIWTVGSTALERIETAARFMVDELQLFNIMIVVDEKDAGSIRDATVFLSEVVRLGGVVNRVCYVGKDGQVDPSKCLNGCDPDAFFMPLTTNVGLETVKKFRDAGEFTEFFIVNSAAGAGRIVNRVPSDVYEIGDCGCFGGKGGRIHKLLEYLNAHEVELNSREDLYAADAYWLIMDTLLSREAEDLEYFTGSLLRDDSGGLIRYLRVEMLKPGKTKTVRMYPIH